MSDAWWYSHSGEKKGPVTKAQLAALQDAGVFTADTLVWTEGAEGWMPARQTELANHFSDWMAVPPPLSEVPESVKTPSASEKSDNASEDVGFEILSNAYKFCLDIYTVVCIGNVLYFIAMLTGMRASWFGAARLLVEHENAILISSLVSLVSMILYLLWVFLAARRSRQIAPDVQTMSPGMTLGFHFIPVLFFYKPLEGMRQFVRVAMRGKPSDLIQGRDFELLLWWALNWALLGVTAVFLIIDPDHFFKPEFRIWMLLLSVLELLTVRMLASLVKETRDPLVYAKL